MRLALKGVDGNEATPPFDGQGCVRGDVVGSVKLSRHPNIIPVLLRVLVVGHFHCFIRLDNNEP
jgi:hypothetical protein